jgi:hypothetical protein
MSLSLHTISATSPHARFARRFEVRHDRIGGSVSPYGTESTYLVIEDNVEEFDIDYTPGSGTPIAVARLVDPVLGLPYNEVAKSVGQLPAPAGAWEIASFNVAPRFALQSAGWVGLWAAVLGFLREVGADQAVTVLDKRTFADLQTVSLKAWGRNALLATGLGCSSEVVLAELDLGAYAAHLEGTAPQSHALYIRGEGLEDVIVGLGS